MASYENFRNDLRNGNMIEAALSAAMPMFHDGRAVCLTDINQQKELGDISCCNGVLIDVKCKNQTSPNTITQCIGLEVIDGEGPGWFASEKKKTTHYIFVNYFADKLLKDIKSPDQFKKLHCMIVSRKELIKFFAANGYTLDKILEDAKTLQPTELDNAHKKRYNKKDGGWLATLTYSFRKPEQPVNLTPNYEVYKNLPGTKTFWIIDGKVVKEEKEQKNQ